jgi:hypothetical protein
MQLAPYVIDEYVRGRGVTKRCALAAAVILSACTAGEVSLTFIAADTVRTDMSTYVSRCPSGDGWLLEAVDSVVTLLIWLPTDSTRSWVPAATGPADRPRAVLQRLARAGIDTWLADSGNISLSRSALGYRGQFNVFGRYQRASGRFKTGRAVADTAACVQSTQPEG